MKRKALITATAVLLVAVMCLATASYAWFASGTASTVASLNIGVSAKDEGFQIATADIKTGDFEAGAFTTATLSSADFTSFGFVSSALDARSTTGIATVTAAGEGTNAKAVFDMFPSTYAEETGKWTAGDASATGYILISFYAKSIEGGTKTFDVTSDTLFSTEENKGLANFEGAVKIGYNVVDNVTLTNNIPNAIPSSFTTYALNDAVADVDAYQPVKAATAVTKKDADEKFVPDTAEGNAVKFADEQTNDLWATAEKTLTFAAGETKLITVALWLEGMDPECSGTWNIPESNKIDITIE